MDDLVTRLLGQDGCCPFCERDPYHYVDIGVGMQAAAVICCDMGIDYFQGGDSLLDKQMGLRREAADRLQSQAAEIAALRAVLGRIEGRTCPHPDDSAEDDKRDKRIAHELARAALSPKETDR